MKEKKKYCDRERPNSKAPLGFLTIQQRIRFLRLKNIWKVKRSITIDTQSTIIE